MEGFINDNIIVTGAAGSGKSYNVIRNVIRQGIEQGEMLVIHDYSGAFYHEFAENAESRGYNVGRTAEGIDFRKKTVLFLAKDDIAKTAEMICDRKIPARLILDEFQNIEINIQKVYQCVAVDKAISIVISVQTLEQLSMLYGDDDTEFIIGNSDTVLYLGGYLTGENLIGQIFSEIEMKNLIDAGSDYMLIHQRGKENSIVSKRINC